MFSFEQVKELIELIAKHGLQGMEVERSGYRLTITGREPAPLSGGQGVGMESPPAATRPPEPPAAPPPSPAGPAQPSEEDESDVPAGAHVVMSPIVGTFYRASAPDAEPFVELGTKVRKGQVLCIVEAMKLMNEIESDAEGEVVKVFPENGQAVEYGEPLFAIATS